MKENKGYTLRMSSDLHSRIKYLKKFLKTKGVKNFDAPIEKYIFDMVSALEKKNGISKDDWKEALFCPQCNSLLAKKKGKNGYFYGCLNYPKCKYTRNLD